MYISFILLCYCSCYTAFLTASTITNATMLCYLAATLPHTTIETGYAGVFFLSLYGAAAHSCRQDGALPVSAPGPHRPAQVAAQGGEKAHPD